MQCQLDFRIQHVDTRELENIENRCISWSNGETTLHNTPAAKEQFVPGNLNKQAAKKRMTAYSNSSVAGRLLFHL